MDHPGLKSPVHSADAAASAAESGEALAGLESELESASMDALELSLPAVSGQTEEQGAAVFQPLAATACQFQSMKKKSGQAFGEQDLEESVVRKQSGADSPAPKPAPVTHSLAPVENIPMEEMRENSRGQESKNQKPLVSSPAELETGDFNPPKVPTGPATEPMGRPLSRQEPAHLRAGEKSSPAGLENLGTVKMPEQESATQTENLRIRKKEIKRENEILPKTVAVARDEHPQKIQTPAQKHVFWKLESQAQPETGEDLQESLRRPAASRPMGQVLESVQAWVAGQEALPESVPAKAARPQPGEKSSEWPTEKKPEVVQDGIRDFTLSIGSIHLTVEEPRPTQVPAAPAAPTRPAAPAAETAFLRWERHYLNSW